MRDESLDLERAEDAGAGGEPLGRREQAKLEKRQRIHEAAREIFAQKGFAAATVQEIAARSGVATGTVFLYAKSKEDLLLQAFAGEFVEVLRRAKADLPPSATTLERLLHLVRAILGYHERLGRNLSAVLLQELMYGPEEERASGAPAMSLLSATLRELVEHGRASGELRARIDPAAAGEMLLSVFHWRLSHWAAGRTDEEALLERVEAAFALALQGLARPGAQGRGRAADAG